MNKEYWFWNEVKLKVQRIILWIFLLLKGLKPSLLKFENWVKTHRLSTSADFLLKTSMRKFFQWFHTIVIRHSCNMRKQISLGHLEIFGQFLYLHYHLAHLKSILLLLKKALVFPWRWVLDICFVLMSMKTSWSENWKMTLLSQFVICRRQSFSYHLSISN